MPSPHDQSIGRPSLGTPNEQKRPGLVVPIANKLHAFVRGRQARQTLGHGGDNSDQIRLVCMSDTHNTRPDVPDGDILLHAGDLSQYGTFKEVQAQLDWLNEQSHAVKVVIAGNHDLILDQAFVKAHPDRELDKQGSSFADLQWGDVVYLQDSSHTVICKDRQIVIFGSPWTPRCGSFAFQYDPHKDKWAALIPDGLDILVTHGPPATHLDQGKGCLFLLREIWRTAPKFVTFGHIHGGHGQADVILDDIQKYYERILMNEALYASLIKLMFAILRLELRKDSQPGVVHLVNAAILTGRDRQLRAPTIAYI